MKSPLYLRDSNNLKFGIHGDELAQCWGSSKGRVGDEEPADSRLKEDGDAESAPEYHK